MRRILLLAVGILALALAVPGIALAHGGGHHKAHKARSCVVPAAARAAHHGRGVLVQGDAGTIASFAAPVLTIRLADGSTLSGKVTARTAITCKVALAPAAVVSHNGGGDRRGDFRGNRGKHRRWWTVGVSALVPGTTVHDADLRLGAGGVVFTKIELVTPST